MDFIINPAGLPLLDKGWGLAFTDMNQTRRIA
jgi:hypothetical protein